MTDSVTRLGIIWKFLGANFLTKVAQILDDFMGFLKNIILAKTSCCNCTSKGELYFLLQHLVPLKVNQATYLLT